MKSSAISREAFFFAQASLHLAKRQFTWLRKERIFRWIDLSEQRLDALAEFIADDYAHPTTWVT